MDIETTDKYKYLGVTINSKHNYTEHIKITKGKVENAIQTVKSLAKNRTLRSSSMESIWMLYNSHITPIIMYGLETFRGTKEELNKLQSMMMQAAKRLLELPSSSPNDAIQIENGIIDIKYQIHIVQLLNHFRIKELPEDDLTKTIYYQSQWWKNHIQKTAAVYDIDIELMEGKTRKQRKKYVQEKVYNRIKVERVTNNIRKTKMKFYLINREEWQVGVAAKYQRILTRNETELILRARTKMLQIKDNFKQTGNSDICRLCKIRPETQRHVLEECIELLQHNTVTAEDILQENPQLLRHTAKKIKERMSLLQHAGDEAADSEGSKDD